MNPARLAWRNLLRNRRRSLTTLSAMLLGMVTILVFGGYVRDIALAMEADFVSRTGHLQIQHRDFFSVGSGDPVAYGVAPYRPLMEAIRADEVLAPMVTVVTPTLQFGAIAGQAAAGVSHTVLVSGVVVEDQNRMMDWNDYDQTVLSRPLSLSDTSAEAAVIGTGVARILHLCEPLGVPGCVTAAPPPKAAAAPDLPPDIGDLVGAAAPAVAGPAKGPPTIELLAASTRGAPNVASVRVVRAEFQGVKELDDAYVGLHLPQAQALVYGAATPKVTAIAVQLHHTWQLERARARLNELLRTRFASEPLAVLDFQTLNPFYGQTLAMFAAIFGFIAVLIGAIVLFTVSNTMSMTVVERTTEIGTLRAIGERRAGIMRMFVLEGLMLGVIGAIVGVACAALLAAAVNALGLTWTPPGRIEPVPLAVRLQGEYWMMGASGAGMVVVAALSALWPAARAARLNIVEALRHV